MARSKLNQGRHNKIIELIEAGSYNEVAAAAAGIGESTFYRWLRKGKHSQSGPYRRFFEAMKKAEAVREAHWIQDINSDPSWQSKAWLLERRFPKRWAGREAVNVSAKLNAEETQARLQAKISQIAERAKAK